MKTANNKVGPITDNFKQYVPKQTVVKLKNGEANISNSSERRKSIKKLSNLPVTIEEMQQVLNLKGSQTNSQTREMKHSRSQGSIVSGKPSLKTATSSPYRQVVA
jgi:hypothetical protein